MTTIENINHDSGPPVSAHWTKSVTDTSSRLSVAAAAALGSSACGLQATATTGDAAATVTEAMTSPSTNELRFRFRYDPNNPNAPSVADRAVFQGIIHDSSNTFQDLILVNCDVTTGSVLQVQPDHGSDTDTTTHAASTITDEPHCFECRIVRASASNGNDGEFEFFVDGTSKVSATGIDNYDNFAAVDEARGVFPAPETAQNGSTYYVDEFIVDDNAGLNLCATTIAFRLLGLAADSGHLYATGLEDSATLKLYDYALSDFSEGTASSFGSATNAQIDAASRGIFPVTRPGAACYLYLYGRDGDNVQVQKNDMNSASGWQDIGAGSATWDASKMAVGLHPSIFDPDDLLAVFTDNYVYRSRDEGTSWTSQGSTTGSLLTSTRFPTDDNKLLVGGCSVGSIDYSHNYGVSFKAVDITGSGSIMNYIEVSL